ncbi:hypothetical protein BJV74DRAFT_491391 [Russula compacta]|nr:hypothetical protein BJV74DRAFT_491391 [Russula compacta]
MLPSLNAVHIGFRSPLSRPDRITLSPPTRAVLPALTHFNFKGVSEYLEDFVARMIPPISSTSNYISSWTLCSIFHNSTSSLLLAQKASGSTIQPMSRFMIQTSEFPLDMLGCKLVVESRTGRPRRSHRCATSYHLSPLMWNRSRSMRIRLGKHRRGMASTPRNGSNFLTPFPPCKISIYLAS